MAIKLNIDDREFKRVLAKYMKHSSRDMATICNTKAFFIARRAVIETPAAKASDINSLLSRKGQIVLGKIINKRRGERGEPGLYGKAMYEAQAVVLAARKRSIAFMKSGWLPAIKALEPLAEKRGAPRKPGKNVKQIGQAKGSAVAARGIFKTLSTIVNSASTTRDEKEALIKYGEPALQKAVEFETKSMLDYIERKMKRTARGNAIKAR